MRNFFTLLTAAVLIGIGIFLTIYFLQNGESDKIPFTWIMITAGAAEVVNVGLNTNKKKK